MTIPEINQAYRETGHVWTCRACGQENPNDGRSCERCQTSPVEEALSWERDDLLDILAHCLTGPFSTPHAMDLYIRRRLEAIGRDPATIVDNTIARERAK